MSLVIGDLPAQLHQLSIRPRKTITITQLVLMLPRTLERGKPYHSMGVVIHRMYSIIVASISFMPAYTRAHE